MSAKILSVDDSKAVRIIIKKAFKAFDVEVVEATNGVEGLSAAGKEKPDLILLDVTMPVMDGVEMLTNLKADADLKGIPVIMLTAEAGRENVLKIAKLGIRDYIVKPFKEDNLIDKVSKVVDLIPADGGGPKKNLDDGLDFLVIEDKPAIVKQIVAGFAKISDKWRAHGVTNTTEAIDFASKTLPDLVIVSLSLPEDGAVSFFRFMRSNTDLKFVPCFGMAVKTAEEEIAKGQSAGITTVITKPIDFRDLENRVVKMLKLDTSGRYFKFEDDILLVDFPESIIPDDLNQIDTYLKPKISEAVDNGLFKVIFDMSKLEGIDMKIITIMAESIKTCDDMGLKYGLVGNDIVIGECSGIEDSTEWAFYESMDEAKEEMA